MKFKNLIIISCLLSLIILSGCSNQSNEPPKKGKGTRNNTPIILKPQADGETTIGNNKITFDVYGCFFLHVHLHTKRWHQTIMSCHVSART